MEKGNIKMERGNDKRNVRLINKMILIYNEEIARLKKEVYYLGVKKEVLK